MKTFILPFLFLGAVLFSSCTKETNEVVIPNQTIIGSVATNMWVLNTGNNSYQATLDLPELDGQTVELDAIQVYISFGSNIWEPLPQVFQGVSYLYSYSPGKLYLDAQNAAGTAPVKVTAPMDVKIVIIKSEY
ncbi:hypothetical protein [Chitinophaga sp. YIM B06452]|uniref:hypothetical protein n=1 Tax=Chitinophaga sp. YIM B06452 TaxID=3082158 RepID=UPI0031FF2EF8